MLGSAQHPGTGSFSGRALCRNDGLRSRKTSLSPRSLSPRGLTLVELTVTLAIIAVMFSAVVVGVGSLTGARAKSSTNELAAVIRALYDQASLTGKTCRLVFELPKERDEDGHVTYRAECAAGAATMSRDREEALREATHDRDERERDREAHTERRASYRSGDGEPTLEELMAQEKNRVEQASRFSEYTDEEIQGRELPSSVRVSVWTRAQRDTVKSGVAYVYFFPQGIAERSMIFVSQGDNAWTIDVRPLTGRTMVMPDLLEVPRS